MKLAWPSVTVGPSIRSPPIGLGRSSTTNAIPARAAASIAYFIVAGKV